MELFLSFVVFNQEGFYSKIVLKASINLPLDVLCEIQSLKSL